MLNSDDYYELHQENLKFVEIELSYVKKMVNNLAASYLWEQDKKRDEKQLEKKEQELQAMTRLYAFLLGNWYEIRLYKIISEKSKVAFSMEEKKQIKDLKKITQKWEKCFEISMNKIDQETWNDLTRKNLESNFGDYMQEISNLITMRNRLGHGQWRVQMNGKQTSILTPDAIINYPDINKLVLLKNKMDLIAKIIEKIVIYKEKDKKSFSEQIESLMNEISIVNQRINKSDLRKYVNSNLSKIKKNEERRNTKI
ncbi:hypothetical protein [Lactococcus lactis]|uniref:hypothetical protein n=1 Tax=Lactococcus lactis TaxID=1358 RepID=UPI0023A9BDE6|nr:hypothetical protein [Lactococcus lactis]WEA54952.1 hypothetical protein PWP91_11850 [Lactococcus lactis]